MFDIYGPQINSITALNKFYKKLEYILSNFKNIIIVGDTNNNLLNTTNRDIQQDYKNMIESNNYSILNHTVRFLQDLHSFSGLKFEADLTYAK